MDSFIVPLITGVGIVFVAVWVLMAVRSRMKKNQKELDKPPEVIEMEMQELIEKAKVEMSREGEATTGVEATAPESLQDSRAKDSTPN